MISFIAIAAKIGVHSNRHFHTFEFTYGQLEEYTNMAILEAMQCYQSQASIRLTPPHVRARYEMWYMDYKSRVYQIWGDKYHSQNTNRIGPFSLMAFQWSKGE